MTWYAVILTAAFIGILCGFAFAFSHDVMAVLWVGWGSLAMAIAVAMWDWLCEWAREQDLL